MNNASLYYVYAIARPRASQRNGLRPFEGIVHRSPVYPLVHRDLLAFVSPVPWDEFAAPMLTLHLHDRRWTHTTQLAHQQVLATLLDGYHLMPLTFCTLYHSKERIQKLLADHYTTFDRALCDLMGASEWRVKVFCDHQALNAKLMVCDDSLEPLRERIALAPAGVAHFLHKQLVQSAEKRTRSIAAACARMCHNRLATHARVAVRHPDHATGHIQSHTVETLLDGAYLIADDAQDAFGKALITLEETFDAQGFRFELTGPQPPYTFARAIGNEYQPL